MLEGVNPSEVKPRIRNEGWFTDPTIWQNDGEIDEELENEENSDLENFDLDF